MEYIKVFFTGGLLCLAAQLLIDKTKLTPARILVIYVCSGVLLTAIGIYGRLVNFASAGATVPLTGFGYALAEGVKKAVAEKGLLGAITGGLSSTAAGVTTAVVFALLWALLFKGRDKNM